MNIEYIYEGDTILLVTKKSIVTGKVDIDSEYMKSHRYEHYLLDGNTLWTKTADISGGWDGDLEISTFLPEDAIIYKGQ